MSYNAFSRINLSLAIVFLFDIARSDYDTSLLATHAALAQCKEDFERDRKFLSLVHQNIHNMLEKEV
ncbi:uncharacterized protein RAG0_03220 [Rhynchosporium agropyri]|uniref:Uncharacterized protein n=1 Tax=Rhynchosporium agropyri TaxID=914238 RepID=A0A1E1K3I8_9HELO|nr:uncharacterized protein RAG0_03220 [Rhynchosporium agropyri]